MSMKKSELPNDIDELKRLLIEQKEINRKQSKKNIFLTNEIDRLKELLLGLRRRSFAPSSESSYYQLPLFNELEECVETEEKEEEVVEEKVQAHTRKRGKRKPLPESLERKATIIELPESEREGMKEIGEDISEKLVIVPAKVFVEQTIRKKYAPITGDREIKTAPLPKQLLPKSIASASLVAYIITSKYVDALPLYRQEKIFKRISADINRSSMARWLINVSTQLMPLYNLLQEKLLERTYLQMDETTTQVLKEQKKKATSKSYMWVRHAPGDNPIVLYDYASSRSGEIPINLLEGFKGILQVDGYDGYSRACNDYKLIRAGCWDHCRRKFFDASKTSKGKNLGKKFIKLIDQLYKIEKKIKDQPLDERSHIRSSDSKKILDEIKDLIDSKRGQMTPKSTLGKAINYTFNEWSYLSKFIDHPEINISNILIENAIRPFAVGRRNWLFSASVQGAQASAMYFSLIETAKRNDLEPFDYLSKMLEKLPHAETADDYERLLPLKGSFKV